MNKINVEIKTVDGTADFDALVDNFGKPFALAVAHTSNLMSLGEMLTHVLFSLERLGGIDEKTRKEFLEGYCKIAASMTDIVSTDVPPHLVNEVFPMANEIHEKANAEANVEQKAQAAG